MATHIEVLHKLLTQLGYKIYPTGSRYFNSDTPHSDFDFFIEKSFFDEYKVEEFLTSLGFYLFSTSAYKDSQTIAVYTTGYGHGKIDIQIVKDASLKYRAQLLLKTLLIRKPEEAQWEAAFEYVKTHP